MDFAVAVGGPLFATATRYLLTPWMGDAAPLVFYMLAILVAALVGGLRAGLVSTALSIVLAYFVIMLPYNLDGTGIRLFALALNGVVFSVIGNRVLVERRRADATDAELRRALRQSDDAKQALAMQARVLESMAEGVCVVTEQGTILFTNLAFDNMFGHDRGACSARISPN
ncbi:MAG: DUF4118 domain-containing protein [Pirellulales bacterium]